MLKRPSTRSRKDKDAQIELNLVPMLDALVTLIIFLMFTMSFLTLVSIESQAPVVSARDVQELKTRPLQLTLTLNNERAEIWSPFDLIRARSIPNKPDGAADAVAIHDALVEVKQRFPTERKIILVPHGALNYDVLVAVMDAARILEKTDAPIFSPNPKTGINEAATELFPEIIFGNLLGAG